MYPQTLLGVLNPQAAMPVNWDTGEILQAEKHKAHSRSRQGASPIRGYCVFLLQVNLEKD